MFPAIKSVKECVLARTSVPTSASMLHPSSYTLSVGRVDVTRNLNANVFARKLHLQMERGKERDHFLKYISMNFTEIQRKFDY